MTRFPVPQIGKATPPELAQRPDSQRANEGVAGMLAAAQHVGDSVVNPGFLVLLKQIREVQIQTATLKEMLISKGVFTRLEWATMERRLTTAADQELDKMMGQIIQRTEGNGE